MKREGSAKLLACCLLSPLVAGCLSPTFAGDAVHETDGGVVARRVVVTSPSGLLALAVSHEDSVSLLLKTELSWDTENYNPLYAAFVHGNGTVHPLVDGLDVDDARLLQGDGILYAGIGPASVQTPNATAASRTPTPVTVAYDAGDTHGVLLVAWANAQPGLALDVLFAPGTTIEKEHVGPWSVHELKDASGPRIGSPALRLGPQNSVTLEGDHVFGYVKYFVGAGSQGELEFSGPSLYGRWSLRQEPRSADGCVCYREGRIVFASRGDVTVDFTFLAPGAQSDLFIAYGAVPGGLLPEPVMEEFAR